ncbi:MAG TPA: hypothetical protein GX687_02005, partial [Clostridia bacterium]|nr:hypothetical protein [Clostridia bacterium]
NPNTSVEEIEEVANSLRDVYPKGGERIMTLAEALRKEGMQKGMQKGRIEGKLEGSLNEKIKITKRLIKKGFFCEEIVEITDFSLDEVQKIAREINS